MKHCSLCGDDFDSEFNRCPVDGHVLLEHTSPLGVEVTELPEGTGELAQELESLLFRFCPQCHGSFGGLDEICPNDGKRLSEPSMLTRQTLLQCETESSEASPSLKKHCQSCNKRFAVSSQVCPECGSSLLEIPPGEFGEPIGSPETVGQLIAGKYRLIKRIGGGQFGNVYLAKHESLGKHYAVKMLRPQIRELASFRDRFHEEALKLSRLDHDNIVRVIDFGEWQQRQYMVTDFVEGQDLGAIIYGEKARLLRAARIMKQVAAALGEAHAKQIVHLDLKPANILVSQRRKEDLATVIDFGIAEIYSEASGGRQVQLCGTPTYMAPEQWRCQALDPRTDIYSFGVIFYELLAGRPPFRHATVSGVKGAHCKQIPELLRKLRPDIPVEIERLIHRCLEKDPARRVQSAADLETALGAHIHRTENAHAIRMRLAWLALGILAILAAGGWAFWERQKDREAPELVFKGVEGNGLVSDPKTKGSRRRFTTRMEEVVVTVRCEARDNRGVKFLKIGPADEENEKEIFSGDKEAQYRFTLTESLTVSLEAFDLSGNPAEKIYLDFERQGPPSVETNLKELPAATKNKTQDLRVSVRGGATAHVSCRNGEKTFFEREVRDGETLEDMISFHPGKNIIEVRLTDVLTGEDLENRETTVVDYLESPLSLTTDVKALPDQVVVMESPGTWLSGHSSIDVVVAVEEAASRLDESCTLRYSLNSEPDELSPWKSGECAEGRKTIRLFDLREGPNEVIIQTLRDRFGNESAQQTLWVNLDMTEPEISSLPSESLTYYGTELPTLHFEVNDRNSSSDADSLELVKVDPKGERPVDRRQFEMVAGSTGWDLKLLDLSPIQAEGRHRFRIVATDRVGNKSLAGVGEFLVLSDHKGPEIKIHSPAVNCYPFRRKDSLELEVEVTEVLSDGLKVDADVHIPGHDSTRVELKLGVGGRWWGSLELDGAKPKRFKHRQPRFTVTVRAVDRAGNRSESGPLPLRFAWENGDQLDWEKSGSVLVYHSGCKGLDPFWLERTEVTNRQFEKFLAAQGGKRLPGVSAPVSPDWTGGRCYPDKLDLPVTGVSWIEVEAYARWADLQPARRREWLAAALWDYAKTTERHYPWGDGWPPTGLVPYGKRKESPVRADDDEGGLGGGRTPLDLLHMWGNVWELVLDEISGDPVPVGGGFDTKDQTYREHDASKTYLHGELPDGPTIGRGERGLSWGFRCMLDAKGENP